MSADNIKRQYKVTFAGRPSLLQVQRELDMAEKVFGQYVTVEFATNGSSDPDLEEVYMRMRSQA